MDSRDEAIEEMNEESQTKHEKEGHDPKNDYWRLISNDPIIRRENI